MFILSSNVNYIVKTNIEMIYKFYLEFKYHLDKQYYNLSAKSKLK